VSKAKVSDGFNHPCQFGNVNLGDGTASVGVRISKDVLSLANAEAALCGRRLTGSIIRCPQDIDPDQTSIAGMDDVDQVEATFDIKQFTSSPKWFRFGICFPLAEISADILSHFARKTGRFLVQEVKVIAPPEKKEKPAKALPGQKNLPEIDEPWRGYNLSNLLSGKTLELLAGAGIETVGELSDYTKDGKKNLTDISGIGPGVEKKIGEMLIRFFDEKPYEAKV
jgi:hypothetical protein